MSETLEYFPESWYPVCMSYELEKGEVHEIEIFNTHLTLFRAKNGDVGLLRSYCPHMGTKLCNGKVHADSLSCPLHLRKYNSKGECIEIPGSDEIPEHTNVLSLPIKEEVGIIFAYLGEKIQYDFPSFPKALNKKIHSDAIVHTLDIPFEALIFNGFDTHHLGCIHNRELEAEPVVTKYNEHRISTEYGMKVLPRKFYDYLVKYLNAEVVHNFLDCYGGNLLVISCKETKDNVFMCTVPINRMKSQIYLVSVSDSENLSFFKKLTTSLRLMITTKFAENFLMPDLYILPNLKSSEKNFYLKQDRGAIDYWNYFLDLPRDINFQKKLRA